MHRRTTRDPVHRHRVRHTAVTVAAGILLFMAVVSPPSTTAAMPNLSLCEPYGGSASTGWAAHQTLSRSFGDVFTRQSRVVAGELTNADALHELAPFAFDGVRIAAPWLGYDRLGLPEHGTTKPALPRYCTECRQQPY